MKTFGIRISEPNYPYNHYIAENTISDDSVLYEWLVADNYEEIDDYPSSFSVTAPEGYLFRDELLLPLSEFTEEEIQSVEDEDSDVWKECHVRVPYREADKALTLLDGVMKMVTPEEFYSLGISEDRVPTFTID